MTDPSQKSIVANDPVPPSNERRAGGLDVAAIRARAQAATPGPWEPFTDEDEPNQERAHGVVFTPEFIAIADGGLTFGDSNFIAAARTDVPALCDRVEALEAELENAVRGAEHSVNCVRYDDSKPDGACDCWLAQARAVLEGAT